MRYLAAISIVFALVPATGNGQTISPGTRIDNVPMYGQPQVVRPDPLKAADEDFIAKAVSAFGTRENASQAWHAQGEEFMRQGDLDFAMRRYNQSWLLNPNNYQPYWGFGRVLLHQKKCDEAIGFFSRALELVDDKHQKVALLSDQGIAYGYCGTLLSADQKEKKATYFENASRLFAQSTELDPSYPDAWFRWSQVLLEQDRPEQAWDKVRRAQAVGYRVPAVYLERLTRRLPEPKK